MKWVKKGGMIRYCDDNTAEKLMQNGFKLFEPVKAEQQEESPATPPKNEQQEESKEPEDATADGKKKK